MPAYPVRDPYDTLTGMAEVAGTKRAIIRRPGAGVNIDPARLAELRTLHGYSRAELAALIPNPTKSNPERTLTPDAITKMENGLRRPKIRTFKYLLEILECDRADLLPPPGKAICRECGSILPTHDSGCSQAT